MLLTRPAQYDHRCGMAATLVDRGIVAASNFLSEFGINYETSIRILANIKQSSFSEAMKNCFE